MKQKIMVVASVAIFIGLISAVFIAFGNSDVEAKQADPNIVVVLRGTGDLMDTPLIDGALCYRTDLYDAKTDRIIGDGVDCLANIQGIGDCLLIERTTFLNLPQGTVVAHGLTTVQPTTGGSPDFTHIVGDIPDEDNIDGDLSTGRFEGATGRVRLSGAVNLDEFNESIKFNCIFVIDLD